MVSHDHLRNLITFILTYIVLNAIQITNSNNRKDVSNYTLCSSSMINVFFNLY